MAVGQRRENTNVQSAKKGNGQLMHQYFAIMTMITKSLIASARRVLENGSKSKVKAAHIAAERVYQSKSTTNDEMSHNL